jgi:hypothetical protein
LDGNGDGIVRVDMGAYEFDRDGPRIKVSSTSIRVVALRGVDPEDRTLVVENAGAGVLDWAIEEDSPWLEVRPKSGACSTEPTTLVLTFNTSGLEAGEYECELSVSSALVLSGETVVVALKVWPGLGGNDPAYAKQRADYLEYIACGSDPTCWLWPYQCDGDADGKPQGMPPPYRVFTYDLAMVADNWKRKIDTADPCADLDHKAQGVRRYRVFTNDLFVLISKWKGRDKTLPGDCPRPD